MYVERKEEEERFSRGYSRRIFRRRRRKSPRGLFATSEVLTIRRYERLTLLERRLVEWIIVLGRAPRASALVLPPLWTMFERRRHSGNQVDSQSAHFSRRDRSLAIPHPTNPPLPSTFSTTHKSFLLSRTLIRFIGASTILSTIDSKSSNVPIFQTTNGISHSRKSILNLI